MYFFHVLPCRVFISKFLCLDFFPSIEIVQVAMTHLWSLPMWIMSLTSASLMRFKCLLFVCILVSILMLNQVVFSSTVLMMVVLSRHGDRESRHDTSVVTSHVNHVVGLSVLHIPQVSSLGQNVINLLFFSFRRDEGRLFLRCFSEHRVERRVVV